MTSQVRAASCVGMRSREEIKSSRIIYSLPISPCASNVQRSAAGEGARPWPISNPQDYLQYNPSQGRDAEDPSAGRVREWRLGPTSWFPPPATSNRT